MKGHALTTGLATCAFLIAFVMVPSRSFTQSFIATPLSCPGESGDPYLGQFQLGLYENDSNLVPAGDNADGIAASAAVEPIDGAIVVLGIGMSNAMYEWSNFIGYLPQHTVLGPSIRLVTGAATGRVACTWSVAYGAASCNGPQAPNQYDRVRDNVLTPAGLTESQVEVVWMEDADPRPTASLPATDADAYTLESYFGDAARAVRLRYPNVKLMLMDSRVYGGYATINLNPEPYAYESGFSVKWLIQAQVNQVRTGLVDPIAGNLDYQTGIAPWLAWAEYEWADGVKPRCSDDLSWLRADFRSDGTHPTTAGENKWAEFQAPWWETSPYTGWLVK